MGVQGVCLKGGMVWSFRIKGCRSRALGHWCFGYLYTRERTKDQQLKSTVKGIAAACKLHQLKSCKAQDQIAKGRPRVHNEAQLRLQRSQCAWS